MAIRWLAIPLLAAGLAWAADERRAVERFLDEFAEAWRAGDTAALGKLFAADFDACDLPPRALPEVWSERTPPRLHTHAVRFLCADVALVDAAWVVYGSLVVRQRTPVWLVLKKEGGAWRLAAYCGGRNPRVHSIPPVIARR